MDTTMNFDYYPLENSGDGYMVNGYGSGANADLDNILYSQSQGQPSFDQRMCDFKTGLTPNGMNMDCGSGGMISNSSMFGPLGFPFPPQQVNPSAIMRPGEGCRSKSPPEFQKQEEVQVAPKPKRTRQSKKKPLTKAQEEQKREEFLERNRVAASKCRKRKQEQTTNLQDHHSKLQLENNIMMDEIRMLEAEIGRLRAVLDGHCASGSCQNQNELEAAIAHLEATNNINLSHGSVQSSGTRSAHSSGTPPHDSPVMGMSVSNGIEDSPYGDSLSRSISTCSNMSTGTTSHNPDSAIDLKSPNGDWEFKRPGSGQSAREGDYTNTFDMTCQKSNASDSSKMSSTFDASDNGSKGTSTITTPEGDKPRGIESRTSGRRGNPRRLGNPRGSHLIDPTLQMNDLQDLQNPSDFLAAH